MGSPELTVLSTFSGLGGLDLGLEAAGFDCVGCVELLDVARRSISSNRPWRLLEPFDITEMPGTLVAKEISLAPGELTLLAGAPPCQPYSKAAMWAPKAWNGLSDKRAWPLHSMLSLVDELLPEAILLENVPGFVRGRHSAVPIIEAALDSINQRHGTGYQLDVELLDAQDHGVPQRRQRAILVALREGGEIAWPRPDLAARRTAWDAIGALELRPEERPVASGRWADLLPSIPEGWNYIWHSPRGGGLPLFGYRTRYWSFLLKLAKAEPGWTIAAQPGPSVGPFHWDSRPLSVRELLRLQTFPESWVIEGTRREQVLQVGNATPPLLAELVGRAVADAVRSQVTDPGILRPSLEIPECEAPPEPEPIEAVPQQYLHLIDDHADHPGSGRGPRPRVEA